MQINHACETEEGRVVFQGVLEGKELAFVIEMGLETLIAAGVVPFVAKVTHAEHDVYDVPDQTQ